MVLVTDYGEESSDKEQLLDCAAFSEWPQTTNMADKYSCGYILLYILLASCFCFVGAVQTVSKIKYINNL